MWSCCRKNRLSKIEQLRNAAGELVQHHRRRFNAQGQLSALIGSAGQQTDFHYSANGDLIQASERDQNPANDNLAHTTQATYDTQHRLLELIDAAGYSTHYTHSASGAIAAVLQQFNSAQNDAKLGILNNWLQNNGYAKVAIPALHVDSGGEGSLKDAPGADGKTLLDRASENRTEFLKWIPQQTQATSGVSGGTVAPAGKHYTESEFGVILPPNTGGQIGNGTPLWSNLGSTAP